MDKIFERIDACFLNSDEIAFACAAREEERQAQQHRHRPYNDRADMTNSQELFADEISNITVTGNIVRIDFASLEPTEPGKQDALAHRQRVIMPLEGFLRAFGAQEAVVKKLIADGKVTRQSGSGEPKQSPG